MKITNINLRKVKDNGARADVTFDNCYLVHDMHLTITGKGLVVSMPSKKVDDQYIDMYHPVSTEMRTELIRSLVQAYVRLYSSDNMVEIDYKP